MDDNAPKENPPEDFNKLDLSQLQGFSFGTQWTQEKPSAPEHREGERPRREDRRDAGPERRDRRTFRRPAGPGGPEGAGPGPGGPGPGGGERREYSGDRGPRREGGGGFRGGPRREGYGGGPRFGGRGGPMERGPYESPYYAVTFYPEDTSFNTLVQTIRKSCRTVELFEIARTVVAKSDRFVVVLAHKPAAGESAPARTPAPAEAAPAAPAAPRPRPMFHVAVPDGMPFETDDAAVAHVLAKHLDKFFEMAEVEVDPPKGNFQVINKCGITGELLGPPNYHRYNQIVLQHYQAKVAGRMSLEAFRSRIETIRDPEAVNQWLAKMKKTTRYTWKLGRAGEFSKGGEMPAKSAAHAKAVEPAEPAPEIAAASTETPAPETSAAETPTAETPAGDAAATPVAPAETAAEKPAAPVSTVPTFDTLEDARVYLLSHAREKVVRTSESARFHGKLLEQMPPGEIRRAIEGALDRQRRFPLDTANALRGRLRREHFTIFKKGSKGVSYVCAVKRKFRVPGQTFADSIGALIGFVEANPMIRASELPVKFLGISPASMPKPVEAAPPAAPAPALAEGAAPAAPAESAPILTIEERARIARLQGDLMWLVREGYVTEFIDGRLFAPPPMVEARKKEIETEEHDPENFPEAPASETPVPPAAGEAAPAASDAGSEPATGEPAAESQPEPLSPANPPAEPAASEPPASAIPPPDSEPPKPSP